MGLGRSEAQFLVFEWGVKVDYGKGLSYRPSRVVGGPVNFMYRSVPLCTVCYSFLLLHWTLFRAVQRCWGDIAERKNYCTGF
jgi:hypothetical protein